MDELTPQVGPDPTMTGNIPPPPQQVAPLVPGTIMPPPPPQQVAPPLTGTVMPPVSVPPDQLIAQARLHLARAMSGARWFYWIAGLSLLNSIIHLFDGKYQFLGGLGCTLITDELCIKFHAQAIGILLAVIASGLYVVFGYFAIKRQTWPFITGIILYALDTLLILLFKDVIMILFHGWALYCIIVGLQSTLRFAEIERTLKGYR